MDVVGFGSVVFAVADAGAGAHALGVAGADDGARAEAVLVFERAFEDVGDDFHVVVGVGAETLAGGDPIVIDNAEGAVAHVGWVVAGVEGEDMAGFVAGAVGGPAVRAGGGGGDERRLFFFF